MSQINQFQIVSNGVVLDTYGDLDFSFTYQIDDIEDITQKKSSYSKTIILPGTKINQEYFKQIQDINIDISNTSYNPKKSLPVEVLVGDEQIFQGNIQLLNIITNQKQTDFEVVITGVFKNIIINLSDYYLDQLNLDEYNHIRDVSTITNSYDNNIYVNGILTQEEVGTGYVYPMTINGQSQIVSGPGVLLNAFDLNPAIYVKTLMDKLFEFAGYTYTSNFFNSPYFKSLIMPLDTPQNDSQDINDRTLRVGFDPNNFYTYPNSPMFPQPNSSYYNSLALSLGWNGVYPLSPALQRSNSYWHNFSSGKWWINFNRETGTQSNITFQDNNNAWSTNTFGTNVCSYFNQTPGFYSVKLNLEFYAVFLDKFLSTFTWNSNALAYQVALYKITPQGASSIIAISQQTSFTPTSPGPHPGYYEDPTGRNMNLSANNVWLNTGDQVRVRLSFVYPTAVSWTSIQANSVLFQAITLAQTSQVNYLEIKPANTINYSISSPLKLSTMLPKLKMKDLFLDVVKMFNLVVYDDPNNPSNLIIEPKDDFYNSKPRVKDWTYKLDYDQDVIQTPMSELDVKTYSFTYKEDQDFYNKQYQELTDRIYGQFTVDFLNDFSTQEKKVELQLAPTPITDNFVGKSNLVSPFFCDIDTNSQLKPVKVKPRILFSKKLSNAPRPYFLRNIPGGATTNLSSYVYCGMYDDPYNPLHTLEFGDSSVLYYNTSLCCPNNTLINEFYDTTLNDLTDVNSKLLEAYFHLTPSDINDFDFRDIILIDNSYWRVNTIVDYNPNAIDKTTKVILYKLNFLDLVFNDNKPVSESEVDCPDDIVAKPAKGGGYIYISYSNQPISQACCENIGGIWFNGVCKANITPGTPIGAGGSTSPNSNTTTGKVVPQSQVKSGGIYSERPTTLLKNQNVNNSNTVIIAGSNNFVDFDSNNSIIIGDNNSITDGITNSIIVGDGITNAPSNSIVVGDVLIDTNGMRYLNPYKIDGGENEVMEVSKTNLIDVVDAGENSVRNFGGDSKLRPIIDGTEPPVI